jgi:hypothetical protein
VNDESVTLVFGDALSELLERPFRRGMTGHVEVTDSSAAHFHDDEHIEQPECRRRNEEKVRSNNGFGMIAYKSHPAL